MNIIREIRKEQHLSIKFVSQMLNLTQKTYKRFENNEITLNKEKLLTKDEIEMSKLKNYNN